jgi:hypothetical protein
MVVNPAYRALDGQVRKAIGRLNRQTAEYGAINLEDAIEPRKVEAFAQRKSDLQDRIIQLQAEVGTSRRSAKRPTSTSPIASCPQRRVSIG